MEPIMYAIFVETELDQICHSTKQWNKEFQDLKDMDCDNIRILEVIGANAETAIYDLDAILREKGRIGRKSFNKMTELHSVKINFLKHYKQPN